MPSENAAKRLPPEALDAFLDGILAELSEPTDPAALYEIRAAFRKRVPFSKRSFAAAALILRAAGLSRGPSRPTYKEALADSPKEPTKNPKEKKPAESAARRPKPEAKSKSEGKAREGDRAGQPSRPRFVGEGTTLFFSMGKRQRLYPRILIDLIIDAAHVPPEAIGEVRAFDNYSFADIDPEKSAVVVSALDGYEFRGRKITVGPAKKRDGQAVAD